MRKGLGANAGKIEKGTERKSRSAVSVQTMQQRKQHGQLVLVPTVSPRCRPLPSS